jgi:hypothetical protein
VKEKLIVKKSFIAISVLIPLIAAGATFVLAQKEVGTGGVPLLRLAWSRVADLGGELGSVECAEFSADGQYIVSVTKYSKEIVLAGESRVSGVRGEK